MGRKIRRRKRSYRQFIEGKITVAERVGFEVDPAELPARQGLAGL
ncbi:MAG TPA: hypothetical protein PLN42_00410 [Anaerolineae bacterium]|nr:hypothetical protein [Anaerolineae bacterium]